MNRFCGNTVCQQHLKNFLVTMDHSPIQQTFEFGKSISTAGKSILNFTQLLGLVVKYFKMWKIQSCKVCEFCILLYYERKSVTTMWKCGNAFSRVIQKYTKFANFTLLYFPHFTMFCNQISLNLESSFQLW